MGGIDMLSTQTINIEENIGTIGATLQETYGRDFDYLALNTKSNILSHKEVRQALGYGINKKEIVNTIYAGKYISADYPLEYGSYLYTKNEEANQYNPDKAKQILQMNGWEYRSGVWQKKENYNTLKLRINLVVNSENETRVKIANLIKKHLEDIGILVTVTSVKGPTYENYLKNKNYDMIFTGVTIGLSPNLDRYFGEGNLANLENNEAKEIQKELISISDEKTLKEKYERLQKIYEEERGYIGLYFSRTTTIYGTRLGATVGSNWFNLYYNIENWHRKN